VVCADRVEANLLLRLFLVVALVGIGLIVLVIIVFWVDTLSAHNIQSMQLPRKMVQIPKLTENHVLVAISPTKVTLAIAPKVVVRLFLGRRRIVVTGHFETLRNIALAVLDVFLDDALVVIGIATEHNRGVNVGGR
jgi:hypothetical protein